MGCHYVTVLHCIRQSLILGTCLVVQQLRLHPSNAGNTGSIPSQGTKIPHAVQCDKKKFFFLKDDILLASLVAQMVKNPLAMQETQV